MLMKMLNQFVFLIVSETQFDCQLINKSYDICRTFTTADKWHDFKNFSLKQNFLTLCFIFLSSILHFNHGQYKIPIARSGQNYSFSSSTPVNTCLLTAVCSSQADTCSPVPNPIILGAQKKISITSLQIHFCACSLNIQSVSVASQLQSLSVPLKTQRRRAFWVHVSANRLEVALACCSESRGLVVSDITCVRSLRGGETNDKS